MPVLLKPLHPSACGFERPAIGNRDLSIIEESEDFFMISGPCSRELAQGLVDLLVLRVPSYARLRLAVFIGRSRSLAKHLRRLAWHGGCATDPFKRLQSKCCPLARETLGWLLDCQRPCLRLILSRLLSVTH